MEINYPNQCIVCKSRNKLRCTDCNMVSYCGRDHQLQHWPIHKTFCQTLTKMLNEKNLSHIYENLDFSIWYTQRDRIIQQVRTKLKRSLSPEETFLLKSPRICFVCRDAKQEKLKNCPYCPTANFCTRHPSSYIHERNCSIMQNRFDLITRKMNFDSQALQSLIKSIGAGTKILRFEQNPPMTMREFLDYYTQPVKISETQKIFLSEIFTIPLTIYSILQMFYTNFPSEIIIHLNIDSSSAIFLPNFWESFLHLQPDVKILKIVYIEGKISHTENVSLCSDCRSRKRQLSVEANSIPYEKYMDQKNYQTPNLIAYFNVIFNSHGYANTINKLNEINCPMLLTFLTEVESTIVRENLIHSSINYSIIYTGYNDFASLMFHHEQIDGSLNRCSQFMIVFKDQRSHFPETSLKEYWSRACFYPTICHICRKIDPKVTCNQCKMISYCSNKHRDRDWIHHRDVCKAIFSLLAETGVENIFDKAKLLDSDSWLRIRIDTMKEIQMRTGRVLEECEKQMFLFPRNCAICQDNDPRVLTICKCGTSLCQIHQNDSRHKKLCDELSIAFQLATLRQKLSLRSISSTSLDPRNELPPSMQKFIENFCKPSQKKSNENANCKDLITSDFLTASLTLNYAVQKFTRFSNNSSIVIHIIGSNRADLLARSSWKLLLYRLENLKTLKVIFIGLEIPEWSETIVDTSDFSEIAVKSLKVESHAMRYDKYLSSKQFIKPDVIFGSNLNIHQCELDMSENFWNETISAVGKLRVPIVLTAGSEKRALKDDQKIREIFNFLPFKSKNPFASLCPERDFETDEIIYSNSILIIYNEPPRFHTLPRKIEKSLVIKSDQQKETFLTSRVTNFGDISSFASSDSEKIDVSNDNDSVKNGVEDKLKSVLQRRTVISGVEKTDEKILERKQFERNGLAKENQLTSVSCENLSNGLNNSATFLMKHNSFLKSENERLRHQLDLAIAEIARLEDKIVEFQKSGSYVGNNV